MKKVILALAIVSVSFAACNNEDNKAATPAGDTTKVETAPPAPVAADTTAKPAVDTTKK